MRVKVVNADGGWQYKQIPNFQMEICTALMPKLSSNWITEFDPAVAIQVRRRRFEFRYRNENGIPVYMEIVE